MAISRPRKRLDSPERARKKPQVSQKRQKPQADYEKSKSTDKREEKDVQVGVVPIKRQYSKCPLHPDVLLYRCKICKGSAICNHDLRRDECNECVPVDRMIKSGRWCHICLDRKLGPERRNKGIVICGRCDEEKRPRTEEVVRAMLLPHVDFPPSMADDVVMGGSTCAASGGGYLRRPDLAWVGTDRVLFVEIDENGGHPSRTTACELGKLWDQASYVKARMGERVLVKMIRFNPDEMDKGREVTLEARVTVLAQRINDFLTNPHLNTVQWRVPHVEYLFYHSKCQFHIDAARKHRNSLIISNIIL